MNLQIHKYGGSSLRTPELIRAAAGRIAAAVAGGVPVVACVSAMGAETDELLALAPRVGRLASPRELDLLITSGEQKAVALVCLALRDLGVPADGFTGALAGIETDDRHTTASIVGVRPRRVQASLAAGHVPVVCGAQGATRSGELTFLGRGGSDTSAVALAAALNADVCELYTDVAGVFSADPRIVADAELLDEASYAQVIAMCHAGCPKPATRAVELARGHGVTIHVRSAFAPGPGTIISARAQEGSVAVVSGSLRRGDGPLAGTGGLSEVSVIGSALGAGARMALAGVLADESIAAQRIGATARGVTCVVPDHDAVAAVQALHEHFVGGRRLAPAAAPERRAATPGHGNDRDRPWPAARLRRAVERFAAQDGLLPVRLGAPGAPIWERSR